MKNILKKSALLLLMLSMAIISSAQGGPADPPADPPGPAVGTPLDSNAILVLVFAGGLLLLFMYRKRIMEFAKNQK